jgi:membrane protein YqaA with SNARE-associated domain
MTPGEAEAAEFFLHLILVLGVGSLGGGITAYLFLKLRERALRRQWRHTSPAGLRNVR